MAQFAMLMGNPTLNTLITTLLISSAFPKGPAPHSCPILQKCPILQNSSITEP
ncbi:hypothetical protein VCHA43P277_10334 [Vibrio chagasii]|nr:hypothetical protein VCHA36P161_10242 [Vibrio chagasii]CAH6971697.1 hypothetical protein VCHA37O173_50002 [Vibrio chagasii]CAH7011517.1 hypothetical protein VCHA29O39_50302 [Vibrio chagasii]CAH7021253.1 hypothetical protein VCHA34P126_60002 [Vibrio chagasii]CAH7063347.1 hypothetical protein VCHA43P277_10334 [Vibrio chagasii]